MAKAISLHVGINIVTPTLNGCRNDAQSMFDLPQLSKFDRRGPLFDGDATLERVKDDISQAAADLEPGGIFVFTFAGHGSRIENTDFPKESELFDATLVCSDFMLLDDVIGRELLPKFQANTRVVFITDSCHSGDVLELFEKRRALQREKAFSLSNEPSSRDETDLEAVSTRPTVRTISELSRLRHLAEHREFYEDVLRNLPANSQINASVILLAACTDIETTPDGPNHGVFTQALLDVLNDPNSPPANYLDLRLKVESKLHAGNHFQTPVLAPPKGQPNPTFVTERPFTI